MSIWCWLRKYQVAGVIKSRPVINILFVIIFHACSTIVHTFSISDIMIQIIILILFFNCFFTNVVTFEGNVSTYENKGLIANGEMYDVEKYPFVVYIVIKVVRKNIAGKSVCTGSLISQWFVLTAAHCTVGVTTSDINVF